MRDLGTTLQSRAVVTAIIALALSLNLRVIARRRGDAGARWVLHRLGCGVMQGYMFSKGRSPPTAWKAARADRAADQAPWGGRAVRFDFGSDRRAI